MKIKIVLLLALLVLFAALHTVYRQETFRGEAIGDHTAGPANLGDLYA